MNTSDAVKRYGSKAELARVLGITPQAISQWGDELPELQALKLEKMEAAQAAVDAGAGSETACTIQDGN